MSAQHAYLQPGASGTIKASTAADETQPVGCGLAAWPLAGFGPAVAAAIADLCMRYRQDGLAHADVNASRAIDVIDLAPGNGFSGHLLIRALQAATRGAGMMNMAGATSSFGFRYLPVVPDPAWVQHACMAAEMSAYRQSGLLLPLVGDPAQPGDLLANGRPYECHNPVVILVHDTWARLPQRLLAVHYGKLLEADLEMIRKNEPATSERPDWRPVEAALQQGAFEPVFARYLDEFNSTPICYPEGAIDAWQRWRRTARHGYLMLANSKGRTSELSMRLHTFPALISAYREDGRLPVHYGMLAHAARALGAATVEQDLPDGQAMQMMMEAIEQGSERLVALAAGFDSGIFQRQALISEALRSVGGPKKLDHWLQLLSLSGHDSLLLAEIGRELALGFSKTADFDRTGWRKALDEIWSNFLPELAGHRLHEKLANAAMHCGHWRLARQSLQRGMRFHGESAADLANLGWCEMRTGQMVEGLALVQRALALDPDHPIAQQAMVRIQERLAQRDDGWLRELRDAHLPLVLEPLDLSHADAYFLQYRDPQIAIMTGLPQLNSIDETRRWIQSGPDERGRVSFAVMHRDHGFVAYVNLAVSEHAAFFCFWTGVDFQGHGYATAAARLVFRHAAAMGVPLMLTSAYKDNRRSIRALERLGFRRIPSRAVPPDQDRIFFVLSDPPLDDAAAHRELVDYYRREDLPLKFADEDKPVHKTEQTQGGTEK